MSYTNNKTSLSNGLSHDIFGFISNLRHKERYKKCQYCMAKSYDKEFNYIIGKRVSCLAKAPWKETNNKEIEKKHYLVIIALLQFKCLIHE